jgi:hypothetical protein
MKLINMAIMVTRTPRMVGTQQWLMSHLLTGRRPTTVPTRQLSPIRDVS